MTMTSEEARKAWDNQWDINRNQDRMIMALGKLQEAKDLINEAEAHNVLDELLGTLPVIGEEIGEPIYELKNLLGIEPNSIEKEIRSYKQAVVTDNDKVEVIHDDFGLLNQLDEFMSDDNFTSAKSKMMTLNYDINSYFADKFDSEY